MLFPAGAVFYVFYAIANAIFEAKDVQFKKPDLRRRTTSDRKPAINIRAEDL